ncbi:ABC transporter permease subunit [Cytobacillus sp. FJAT-54145]|uniref:ABC transporter permease subunit n=1 Tax=Cytobacillus spartinae TaxID=3299023 RepID=A0ABW6K710_9BACI
MKKSLKILVRAITIIVGICFFISLPYFVSVEPGVYEGEGKLSLSIENAKLRFEALLIEGKLSVTDTDFLKYILDTDVKERYSYTLTILGVSVIVVSLVGLIITFMIVSLPLKIREMVKPIINMTEAIPDLLIIFLFQIGVITLYKSTGIKFLKLYGIGENPYFIPIVTISFLPIFFLIQFMMKVYEDEENQHYVLLAKAKGLNRVAINLKYIFANTISFFVLNLRTIVWIILSNIILVEFIFNIKGFSEDLFRMIFFGFDPITTILYLFLFTAPILLIDFLAMIITRKQRIRKGELSA